MSEPHPQFTRPPVVETVMSVQFDRLQRLSGPLVGWYWRECLGDEWPGIEMAAPLKEQFETFDSKTRWARAGVEIGLLTGPPELRYQISEKKGERLIQVQSSRFVYNWRKREHQYPSYRELRPEFDQRFAAFSAFTAKAGLGDLNLNQWEMTYVNHVAKNDLWQDPSDWGKILPKFYYPDPTPNTLRFEGVSGEWQFVIEPKRGRLHVEIQRGRVASPSGPEVLALKLTARGPLGDDRSCGIGRGFDLGHDVIVTFFDAITSSAAKQHWGKKT